MARAYRKKSVVVEAVQWTGENHAEMCEFIDPEAFEIIPRIGLVIHTLEGDHHASPGDYIIKGVNGEFYPCKPDIFAKTYESSTLTQPNEPLTWEELEKLKNSPVYIEVIGVNSYWAEVIGVDSYWALVRDINDSGIWLMTVDDIDDYGSHRLYGKTWLAYRRPPEGEA